MPLTQTQLASEVAERSGLSKSDAKAALAALEEIVLDELANASRVRLAVRHRCPVPVEDRGLETAGMSVGEHEPHRLSRQAAGERPVAVIGARGSRGRGAYLTRARRMGGTARATAALAATSVFPCR